MSHENNQITLTAPDELLVNQTITHITSYLQTDADSQHSELFRQSAEYIDGLYETFAPQVSADGRMVARAIGGLGLAHVAIRYGTDEFHPSFYSGNHEKEVLATYHHAGHSRDFIENGLRYAAAVNQRQPNTYTSGSLVRVAAIGSLHDAVMGNGRGTDERQSALLAASLLQNLGFTAAPDQEVQDAIKATTWDDVRQQQACSAAGPYAASQRLAAVADLLPLFDRRGPYQNICVTIEDMCKQHHGQAFTRELRAMGASAIGATIDDCVELVDSSLLLRSTYGRMLQSHVGFFGSFAPADPHLDEYFPGRPANIELLDRMADGLTTGRLTAQDTLHMAREFRSGTR